MENDMPPADAWDDAIAEGLLGKHLLVGFTSVDSEGTVTDRRQYFGQVVHVDKTHGIAIELHGINAGKSYWLPPDIRGYRPADPGSYRLRSTGEVVVNPDFIAEWTVETPPTK